ncbi:MAG: glycosyltransferase family 39 protein [bacterium]
MEFKKWWRDLVLVFTVALVLRLAFNWNFVTNKEHADIASMYQYALRVARGIYYGEGAYWPPGFIFLSGGLIRLFGPDRYWTVVRYLQSFLGALTCIWGYLVARAAFANRLAALLGGFLLAFYLPLIYYTGLAFSETLFLFFFLLAVVLLYQLKDSQSVRDAAWAGFVLGLASLTRPVSLLVPVLVVPWYYLLWNRRWRPVLARVAVMGAVLLMTLMPWALRNLLVTGELVLVDVNGGINFYIGHNERATGTWMDLGQKTNPVILLGGSPDAGKLGYRRGLEFILNNPRQELSLAWTKFYWFWTKPSDWYISRWASQHRIPHLEPPVWGALAVVGALLTLRRWRGTAFLVLFVLYYNAIIVAIYYASRYRLVVEPFWLLLVAGGFAEAVLWLRSRRRLYS